MKSYAEKRKNLSYYKYIRNIIYLLSIGKDSIIDIGSNGVDIISHTECKLKISLDRGNPIKKQGVVSIKEDFFEYYTEQHFDIVTCFQVLEHIEDASKFANKLLSIGKIIFISVPYKWKKGYCEWHCQDPVDEHKLDKWFGKKALFMHVIDTRLLAIYTNDNGDIHLNKINNGDFTDFTSLLDSTKKYYDANFIDNEYKKIISNNLNIDMTYSEILDKAKNTNEEQEKFFRYGMLLYPFVLDNYGHPIFLKEYVRFLVNNRRFDEARSLLASDTPSTRIKPVYWANIIFSRAYKKFGIK